MSSTPAPSSASSNASRGGVLVYNYYTYLTGPENVVPVLSSGRATLDFIESLPAVPVFTSALEADPSEICELGFFKGPLHTGHD